MISDTFAVNKDEYRKLYEIVAVADMMKSGDWFVERAKRRFPELLNELNEMKGRGND